MSPKSKVDDDYFKSILENSPTSIQIYSTSGYLKGFNKAFESLFDVDGKPFIGVYNILEDPQLQASGIIEQVKGVLAGKRVENLISRYDATDKNGRERWLRSAMFPVLNEAGEVIDFVVMHEDYTDLKNHELYLEKIISDRTMALERVNRELEAMAKIDVLTTLFNRRAFDATFQMEYEKVETSGCPLSLILIDVDYFKHYNDCYGHPSGDAILQRIAAVIKENVHRASDAAVRYGGDEFAIVLPMTDSAEALCIAERVRKGVEALEIVNQASPTGHVTLSLGLKTYRQGEAVSRKDFFESADQALYHAKATGKNRSVLF